MKKKPSQWVSWFKLLNLSKHQTLDQLRAFLIEKGLSDGYQATPEALAKGYARVIDGKERWHRAKYIRLMKSSKKVKNNPKSYHSNQKLPVTNHTGGKSSVYCRCRDCSGLEKVPYRDFGRAASPRCSGCGGILDKLPKSEYYQLHREGKI